MVSTNGIENRLHPLEKKLLLTYGTEDVISAETARDKAAFSRGQFTQSVRWLASKELISLSSKGLQTHFVLTDVGRRYKHAGLPETRLYRLLQSEKAMTIPEIADRLDLPVPDIGSAYGKLAKESVLFMDDSKKIALGPNKLPGKYSLLASLLNRISEEEKLFEQELSSSETDLLRAVSGKRNSSKGLFRIAETEVKTYRLTGKGVLVKSLLEDRGNTGDEIGPLTPDIIQSKSWKNRRFRIYSTNIPPQRVPLGRKNAFVAFLESLKDKLISFGFEEFEGPLIEPEFWNADALFMPQFHSARDIHDVYYVKEPKYAHPDAIGEPYLSSVAMTHENGWKTGSRGWRYGFDKKRTHRMVLRSQGTVLSAKMLRSAKVPGKYFGVARCFRYDQVDATHLPDFYQTEGIVLSEQVNLRTLLGLLKMFAVEVARAQEIKFVPGYFPFTEPSVEVHIKHPTLGWFELGGAGIFRPEVTLPLGISVPVLAWGLGIDRMALISLGLNDIRDLFTNDIEKARMLKAKVAKQP